MARSLTAHLHATDDTHAVTPLELFFDLVFVYAITQVTSFMAADPHTVSAFRGVVVLGLLWFGWVSFAWLGNQAKADEGLMRVTLVLAMGAMFVVAVAIPEAWNDRPGGLYAPLVFVLAYAAGRALHLSVYFIAAAGDAGLRRTLVLTAAPVGAAMAVLVAGAFLDGAARTAAWAAALAIDFTGVYVTARKAAWRLPAAALFAERHGLIVLIALGESIVAIGVGATALPVSGPVLVAVLLGLAVIVALWWLYFDVVAIVAEGVLTRARGSERADLARDSYTYLHFPMVVGIVYLALGLKKVVTLVADDAHYNLSDALTGLPLVALYGGVVLYLLAHVGFRLRNVRSVSWTRLTAAAACLALIPVALHAPAVLALALLLVVCVLLIAYEVVVYAEARARIRAERIGH